MIAVCEIVDGMNQGWMETSFRDVEEWKKALNAYGRLIFEPSLTTLSVLGFRLLDPPNQPRIFRVALNFKPEEHVVHHQV